jgi:hypothetical protein
LSSKHQIVQFFLYWMYFCSQVSEQYNNSVVRSAFLP